MKRNLITKAIIGLSAASQLFGCNKSPQSTTLVTSGFAMTASAKPATVARFNGKGLYSVLFPNAQALVP